MHVMKIMGKREDAQTRRRISIVSHESGWSVDWEMNNLQSATSCSTLRGRKGSVSDIVTSGV